jgi:hypothetical protein
MRTDIRKTLAAASMIATAVWLAGPAGAQNAIQGPRPIDKTQTCPPPVYPRGHVAKSYDLCGESLPGCPNNPPSHMQTLTVSNKGVFVSHVQVWFTHQVWTCGNASPVLAGGTPNVDKTLLAGQSWSQTYDSTASVATVTFYINGGKQAYCAENNQVNGSPDSVQLTASGATFDLHCSGGGDNFTS